jgi:lysophospholipase L1-like esterase
MIEGVVFSQRTTETRSREPPATRRRWFHRHPRLALLLVNGLFAAVCVSLAEIGLRVWVPYNPGYYVVLREGPGVYKYPFGELKQNSRGFPDDEFDLASPKPRVGYFGDSVTRGVGAGHGYRITDLLERLRPEVEHWTFEVAVNGIDAKTHPRILAIAEEFRLAEVVYLLNLNDLLPTQPRDAGRSGLSVHAVRQRLKWLDQLRGRSYLYSALRFRFAELMMSLGYGHQGWRAAEFFPHENAETVRQTAERITALARAVAAQHRRTSVILLPYEMQISDEAARTYAELGIHWEPGFLERSTQAAIQQALPDGVQTIDAYWAFVDPADEQGSRRANGVGEYFVFDRGDKLDWNHPNRAGHAKIAEYLAHLGEPEEPVAGR